MAKRDKRTSKPGGVRDLVRNFLDQHSSMLGAKCAAHARQEGLPQLIVDSQIITLQGAGVDSLIIAATAKPAAQTISKVYDLRWTPERFDRGRRSSRRASWRGCA